MSVKLRRYMSVWMLLVAYCFSVGAAAYAVLSCHCLERERGEGHIYFDIISKALAGRERGRNIIYVAPREVSKAAGQRRCNLEKLKELGYECRIKESARLTARDIDLEKVNLL